MSDTNPRPSYFSQIRIDPNNDQKLWMGGVNIYMSEDGGRTFSRPASATSTATSTASGSTPPIPTTSFPATMAASGSPGTAAATGLTSTTSPSASSTKWRSITRSRTTSAAACRTTTPGAGRAPPPRPAASAMRTGSRVQGGDGFYNRIDPSDPNIIYAESQDGNLSRRDLRTSESKSIRPLEPTDTEPRYRFQWNSPLMISPHDPKTIYYGGNHLFKSTDRGDTWEVLGEDLTTEPSAISKPSTARSPDANTLSRHDGVVAWPCITAIAESPVKAGRALGRHRRWQRADVARRRQNLDQRDQPRHGRVQNGIRQPHRASYKDAGTVYLTFDNHRSADYAIYIYRTTNYGDSFQRITNGIPPEAGTVHVIREDPVNPNLLFAGTEFGIFVTFDKGANWRRMKNGLPTVPVFDIQIHPREHDLILATHGRSIWISWTISGRWKKSEPMKASFRRTYTCSRRDRTSNGFLTATTRTGGAREVSWATTILGAEVRLFSQGAGARCA